MRLLITLILIISFGFLQSETYHSGLEGGDWFSPGTWVNGKVPSGTDDVVINGKVTSDKKFECKSLTINRNSAFIVDVKSSKPNIILGDLKIIGCMEISDSSFIKVKGKVDLSKQEYQCFFNSGTIEVGND